MELLKKGHCGHPAFTGSPGVGADTTAHNTHKQKVEADKFSNPRIQRTREKVEIKKFLKMYCKKDNQNAVSALHNITIVSIHVQEKHNPSKVGVPLHFYSNSPCFPICF